MSRYPSCVQKPLTGTSRSALRKDLLCLHTMVGYLGSTWNYFNRSDVGVYSHIGVGGPWGADGPAGLDGVAWQMADTDYRAAANLDGNWRIISVETADNAARPIQPWTAAQQTAIVRIMVDAHRLDGIPLVLVPDSKPGRRGIAYHRLGCDPYRVDGGEKWSSSYGKDCPTDARIHQIPGLLDRARDIVAGHPAEEIDVTAEANIIAAIEGARDTITGAIPYGVLVALDGDANSRYPKPAPGFEQGDLSEQFGTLRADVTELKATLGRLESALAALVPPAAPTPTPGA